MDKDKILAELKEIITAYVPEPGLLEKVTAESDLINDLQINSAHIVDIVLDIEDKYDIMIEDDVITRMVTVGEAVNVIFEKVESK